jgi:hypothetical protein
MHNKHRYTIRTKGPILFSTRGWIYVAYAAFLLACLVVPWVVLQ